MTWILWVAAALFIGGGVGLILNGDEDAFWAGLLSAGIGLVVLVISFAA